MAMVNRHVGITTKQELEFSPYNRPINTRFINKPLSNYDLSNWINQLKVKHFRGIFSRDNLPNKIKKECGIINLYSKIGMLIGLLTEILTKITMRISVRSVYYAI